MARAGILYSQVARAAAQLAADGKNPTVDSVREALGGTGSKSTIAPMLKRWKSEHQETVAEAELGLPAELVHAVKDVYDKLQTSVTRQIASARESHQQEQEAMAERLKQAAATNQALRDAKDHLDQELAQLKGDLEHLQRDHHATIVALTAAQTENAGLQQRLADRVSEVHSLTQQLTQSRAQFEHYQETTARQRTEERQAFEQRIARFEQDLASAQRQQVAQQTTLVQQEAKLSQLTADNERLDQALHSAQTELSTVRGERDQLTYQVKELSAIRNELDRWLQTAQQALTETKMMAATAQKQAEMLAQQLASTEAKADKMEQERLVLIQTLAERSTRATANEATKNE